MDELFEKIQKLIAEKLEIDKSEVAEAVKELQKQRQEKTSQEEITEDKKQEKED